ncbi:DUF3426 domain-containing protein [Candidimonas sp. SYP-B2681]|uniref:DUF3426 domain-containing protein n=1 Tax=Candidimonas sp. SYP-B2681 TaxID=2497686 RepID=UPI001F32260D|nr:DUF3426 domain-containing protein [Candidimonas sp. SYP-B2681]
MPSVVRQRATRDKPAPFVVSKPTTSVRESQPAFTISPGREANQARRQDPVFRIGDAAHVKPDPIHPDIARRPDSVVKRPDPIVAGPDRSQKPAVGASPPPLYVEPRRPYVSKEPDAPKFLNDRAPGYAGVLKLLWSVLIVIGLLLLLAQLAYVYRSQIANQIPALRPVLTQACEALNCRVAYSRRIDMISIMSSSLRASPGAASDAPDSMTLRLTLRNTLDKPQEWPTLVLDLTDFSGTVVVRKNLPPAAYLPSETLQGPFAAESEVAAGVPIVLNDIKVNGYQLGKFFP